MKSRDPGSAARLRVGGKEDKGAGGGGPAEASQCRCGPRRLYTFPKKHQDQEEAV